MVTSSRRGGSPFLGIRSSLSDRWTDVAFLCNPECHTYMHRQNWDVIWNCSLQCICTAYHWMAVHKVRSVADARDQVVIEPRQRLPQAWQREPRWQLSWKQCKLQRLQRSLPVFCASPNCRYHVITWEGDLGRAHLKKKKVNYLKLLNYYTLSTSSPSLWVSSPHMFLNMCHRRRRR